MIFLGFVGNRIKAIGMTGLAQPLHFAQHIGKALGFGCLPGHHRSNGQAAHDVARHPRRCVAIDREGVVTAGTLQQFPGGLSQSGRVLESHQSPQPCELG